MSNYKNRNERIAEIKFVLQAVKEGETVIGKYTIVQNELIQCKNELNYSYSLGNSTISDQDAAKLEIAQLKAQLYKAVKDLQNLKHIDYRHDLFHMDDICDDGYTFESEPCSELTPLQPDFVGNSSTGYCCEIVM